VAKTARAAEITKAYRKLAKKLHPDLNPGDKAAEEKFKKISAAYGIVGDEEKRGRYDRGEIDASGQETQQQRYYREYAGGAEGARYRSSAGFEDIGAFSDLFGDLFGERGGARAGAGGRRFSMRGQDAHYRLDVDFLDAVNGTKTRITLPDGGTLDVTIPPGVTDGQVLRLRGKGNPGLGEGEPGDALIEIGVKPHPVFKREGDDIVVEVPITFDEAVLGGKVEVPTIGGRVFATVPPGANTGQTLRLKGRGIKSKGGTGDQLVKLSVVLPERIDEDLKSFAETWREAHRYDPRRKLKEQA
jgi:DnaJ-class molecular chaperone